MSLVSPGSQPQPSEEWLRETARALSAFAVPRLQPSTVELINNLRTILEAFYRSVDETARPLRARFAKLAQGLATTVFTPEYLALLEQIHDQRPANWPSAVNIDVLMAVIRDDGLPLVWVPRRELVEQVLAAPNRAARVDVLCAHQTQVIQDCRRVLAEIMAPALTDRVPLARAAVEALAAGHEEAAQALATVVTESAIAAAVSPSYKQVQQKVLNDIEELPADRLRLVLALAPVHRFYTPWYASWGTPAPEALSRHMSVHQADVTHYTPANALIAIMLASSVLRSIAELGGTLDPAVPS